MIETESNGGNSADVSLYKTILAWMIDKKFLFALILVVVLAALIPLYGMLFPPNVDLPEHILISKLLFEKLTGVSQMDMEISFFIAYRLIPVLFVSIMSICKFLGIPFIYLPIIIVTVLVSFHAIVVVTILYFALRQKNLTSYAYAACFILPAVVCLYSACWFIGFVNFTLAITLLLPTLFLTERFLQSGKILDGLFVFVLLLLTYSAHPFAPTFWLLWCLSRSIVTVATGSFLVEWKRLLSLGLVLFPLFLYHFLAISGTEFAAGGASFLSRPLFTGLNEWYNSRFGYMFSGEMFKVDGRSDSRIFAIGALGMIAFSTILAFRVSRSEVLKKLALSSVTFLFLSSWLNEGFFPIPKPHWLAYDYRFASVAYAVCVTTAAWILIRFIPRPGDKPVYKRVFTALAAVSILAATDHLFEVRKAYARFDSAARPFMAKVFNNEPIDGIQLPHGKWHPDGTLIRLFICLEQPDCNPKGTTFESFGGALYAVRLKSRNMIGLNDGPKNAFDGGAGSTPGKFARPRGVAADAQGNIYVADTDNARVQKFDRDGVFISAFGTRGVGEGELREPNGIAVDIDGFIYVADAARSRLIRFNPDGTFVKEWKCPDRGFYKPRDLAIGPDKQLYVVDQGFARIVKFDPATEKFTSWEIAGEGDSRSRELTGIAIGGGFVFVADIGNNLILVLSPDGKFVREWKVPSWEAAFRNYPDTAFDEKKKVLYVTNGRTGELLAFDINGNSIDPGFKPDSVGKLENPSSLFLSVTEVDRVLYILNTAGSRVTAIRLAPKDQNNSGLF